MSTLEELADQLLAATLADDKTEMARVIAELHALPPDRIPELLPSALWYASQGLWVFPLTPRSKIPLPGSHGCRDATNNEERIRQWWATTPNANIGIATGHLVDVIDIDGPVGVHTWVSTPDLPLTIGRVSTPRNGGHHLYVPTNPNRRNQTQILPGIDYRGAGGYVVAPPSTTPVGAYKWTRPLKLTGTTP